MPKSPAMVPLRHAAEIAVTSLKKIDRSRLRGPEYLLALTSAAVELSFYTPIFHRDADRKLVRITPEDLRKGTFDDGGNLLRLKSGAAYRHLVARRDDVLKALEALASRAQGTKEVEAVVRSP